MDGLTKLICSGLANIDLEKLLDLNLSPKDRAELNGKICTLRMLANLNINIENAREEALENVA